MRNLLTDPLWHADNLGAPVPDSRHACSVCMPTWQSVIDYEEGRDKVLRKLETGYPRFILHQDVSSLFSEVRSQYAVKDQDVMVFPTREAAQRAQRFLELQKANALEIKSYKEVYVLVFPKSCQDIAKSYWRYTGEGISSRQAKCILDDADPVVPNASARTKVAELFDADVKDIHLWSSGMSAIFHSHRFVISQMSGKKSLQVDFPYVDAMRVQQSFGAGVVFLSNSSGEDFRIALERIRDREFSAVFTEVSSNPLLETANLEALSKACHTSQTPLIIDETVASHYNVDILKYADVVTTSLTKWISGKGDVLAGATRINKESPFAEEFRIFFDDQSDSGSSLYVEDEAVLVENMNGFAERMVTINESAEKIADFLSAHDAVAQVHYPKFNSKAQYDAVKTEHGGYGGLMSIILNNEKKAPAFFDALKLTKGPSLGTEFSLVCPYTLLAHYDELEFAEANRVPKNLIRLSVGIEPTDHLLAVLKEALEVIA